MEGRSYVSLSIEPCICLHSPYRYWLWSGPPVCHDPDHVRTTNGRADRSIPGLGLGKRATPAGALINPGTHPCGTDRSMSIS